ncbi:hypothetical protein [Mycobacterium sp. NAZ190054]|uniref:hypothetical protein n=1 Tax=Mycobacterium sp. NAZ190054 TaxID=1747766 RepID=UPI0007979E0B|nr:hypothetical protein [Mycobacterium sp. NAZ190054]KWX66839.1 hypothetical protein ASJ79_05595 [Mycobacterium sp. NAZ190054]
MKVTALTTAAERSAYLFGVMEMHSRVIAAFDETIGGSRLSFLDAFEENTKALLTEIESANQGAHQ